MFSTTEKITHAYADLESLAAESPVFKVGPGIGIGADTKPNTDDVDRRLVKALYLDVLGERENGNVVAFASHPDRRKTVEIRDCDRLSYARLLQIAGPPVLAVVDESGDEPYSKFTISQVRNSLCSLAGAKRLGDEALVGPGCWQPLDGRGDDLPGVLLVGAGEAAHWDAAAETLTRITVPRACGRLLDMNSSRPWYNFDQLQRSLAEYTPARAIDTIEQAVKLFARWRWKHPTIHPETLVGLLLASWVQTLWQWRPHVALIGASKSGKSILMETLDDLFCGLVVRSSKSSAAGIRQHIQQSAGVVLVDEFEHSRHRRDVLELARASSRGDRVLRGTTGHRGTSSVLQHIFWIAAVEVGLKRAPDRNRYIVLETMLPAADKQGQLHRPPTSEMHKLGTELLAIAIRSVAAAKSLATRLKAARIEGVDSRAIESYAVPAAMLASACGFSEKEALGLLASFLKSYQAEENEDPSDELELLRDIAMADMRGDKGVTVTVAQALRSYGADNAMLLGRHGITFTAARRGPRGDESDYVFFDHRAVVAKLLKGTDWEGQNIDVIIARLEGARKSRRTVGGRFSRGVIVPWAWLKENIIEDDQLGFSEHTPPQEDF